MDIKDQIKSLVSIIDVASLYVNLKPAGKYFKSLCPFHAEKTPSFFVMPEKNIFSCYGCNKFGDIFTLIQEMENISFPEAINFLIDKFNIPVEKKKGLGKTAKEEYLEINKIALQYFQEGLYHNSEGKEAQEYLSKRGINKSTWEMFSVGYALRKWEGLYDFLNKKSVDGRKALELGLIIKNDKNQIYDRFRGRIIFPIFSESGDVIAFGGRTVFSDTSKYLNSPDTPLYKKGYNLYGFNFSKEFIKEKKSSILVEGYFDMISLYHHGIKNCVASLGTALTESQIYLLKRFSDNIYIFYDSDKAGISAARKGIEKMLIQNFNPKIISSSDSKDPDEFIRQHGLQPFLDLIVDSTDGFSYLLNNIAAHYDLNIPEQKKNAIDDVMMSVEKIEDIIIREEYSKLVADFFDINMESLKFRRRSKTVDDKKWNSYGLPADEKMFLESILLFPDLIDELRDLFNEEILSVLDSKNILLLIFKNYQSEDKRIELKKVFEGLNESERSAFNNIFWDLKEKEVVRQVVEKNVETSFLKFQSKLNKRKILEINKQIRKAERESDFREVKKLMDLKNKFLRMKYKRI